LCPDQQNRILKPVANEAITLAVVEDAMFRRRISLPRGLENFGRSHVSYTDGVLDNAFKRRREGHTPLRVDHGVTKAARQLLVLRFFGFGNDG